MGNNKNKKEKLHKYEKKDHDIDETEKTVIILKNKLEEDKMIE
jgi:hypothetical protein